MSAMGHAWEKQFRDERDAARAEKATLEERIAAAETHLRQALACEYDGHAEHITAAMRALRCAAAPVAPVETAEADGRVGDLVRFGHETLPLLEVFHDETVGFAFGTVARQSPYRRKVCSQLQHMERKPVEVGDTVRCTAEGYESKRGKVVELGAPGKSSIVITAPGSTLYMPVAHLVAVAP